MISLLTHYYSGISSNLPAFVENPSQLPVRQLLRDSFKTAPFIYWILRDFLDYLQLMNDNSGLGFK